MEKNNVKGQNPNNREVRIPEDVSIFCELDYKKFKKSNKGDFSKKEMKANYYSMLVELAESAIEWVVRFGHINQSKVKNTKNEVFTKLIDPDFLKAATTAVKDLGVKKLPGFRLFPLVASEMLKSINEENEKRKAEGNNVMFETSDIIKLSKLTFAKKYKKLVAMGIDETVVFNILMTFPHKSCMEFGRTYRIRMVFETMYTMSKASVIPFDDILDVIIDKEYYGSFVVFALLERKSRFTNMTVQQQKLYTAITKWCIEYLENCDKFERAEILKIYVKTRQKDLAKDNDAPRRYPLTTLSTDDYPNVVESVNTLLASDATLKEYLD